MQMINNAKTKRIVVCEYDLNKGIAEEKFFDFVFLFKGRKCLKRHLSVQTK